MSARWVLAVMAALPIMGGAQAHKAAVAAKYPVPTGPVAVIDTNKGRLTCQLFDKQVPVTVANFVALATGAKDWPDVAGAVQHGKPFYDGTALIGITDGIAAGDRVGGGTGTAGPAFTMEKTGLGLDHPGLLAMNVEDGKVSSSRFVLLTHADLEYEKRVSVFGVCDAASVTAAEAMSHEMLTVGNHPVPPVAINKVSIVKAGEALPPVAADVPSASVVPQYGPPPPASMIPSPEPTGPTAVIETSMGTLTCRLFNETKVATENFVGLATGAKPFRNPATKTMVKGKPFYNGLHFNRVLPDFMVEQGDLPGDGSGDGSIGFRFPNEIVPGLTFDRPGRLAYANAGPTTNSSEWFVTEHEQHRLDGNYTIFGQCDPASVKVVEAIARVPRNAKNEPLKPVVVKNVTISR